MLAHKVAKFLGALFFLAPLLTTIIPRLTLPCFVVLGASLSGVAFFSGGRGRETLPPGSAALFLLAGLYILLSAAWASNPSGAAEKAALLVLVALLSIVAIRSLTAIDPLQLTSLARALLWGLGVGASFVLFEVWTDGVITRSAMNTVSWLQPETSKHVKMQDGLIARLDMSRFNHHATMLALQLWPALLLLTASTKGRSQMLLASLFLTATVVAIFVSEHDSSQLAIIVSLFVGLLAKAWPRMVVRGLALMWCVGFIVIIPLVHLAYDAGLHKAESLPKSFRARIIIWDYTAEKVASTPWLGIGAGSTKLERQPRSKVDLPPGFVFPRATGQHAHNVFLQTWFELGLFGAIIFAVVGAAVILRILLLPPEVQPFAAASFAVFGVIASFAWGMWQSWWVCAIGLMVIYLCLGAALLRRHGTEAPSDAREPIRNVAR